MNIVSDSVLEMWQKRNTREQYLLIALFIGIVGGGLYQGVIGPIVGGYNETKEEYQTALEDYRWLQDKSKVLQRLYSEKGGLSITKPVTLIEKDARAELKKLNINSEIEILQRGNKEFVQIKVKSVPAVAFMRWLDAFARNGIVVQEAALESRKDFLAGKVILRS